MKIEDIITVNEPEALPNVTAAELRSTREYLGLSTKWVAEKLVIGERRIQRMENGQEEIPEVVAKLIDDIAAEAKDMVEQLAPAYRRAVKAGEGKPVLLPTWRTDNDAYAAGQPYPSRFYRHVAARVADAAAGTILVYKPSPDAREE